MVQKCYNRTMKDVKLSTDAVDRSRFYSISDLCSLLGVSPRTVRNLAKPLFGKKIGKHYIFYGENIVNYFADRRFGFTLSELSLLLMSVDVMQGFKRKFYEKSKIKVTPGLLAIRKGEEKALSDLWDKIRLELDKEERV